MTRMLMEKEYIIIEVYFRFGQAFGTQGKGKFMLFSGIIQDWQMSHVVYVHAVNGTLVWNTTVGQGKKSNNILKDKSTVTKFIFSSLS